MLQKIQRFVKKLAEKGQGVVEYALVLGFVAILAVALTSDTAGLKKSTQDSITQAKDAATKIDSAYNAAKTAATPTEP